MQQVSPHVFVDPQDGPCTVGAIKTNEGVVLIDSPHQPTRAKRWVEEVKVLGEVRYLINTEFHADHTFGNAFLPGIVISHLHTKKMFWEDGSLGTNFLKDPKAFTEMMEPGAVHMVADYKAREPEITFEGSLQLSLGGVGIEAFPMHGHIAFETAVYVPQDKVLFTGDNVFNNVMTWYHDALPFEWLETLDRFKEMDVEVVVPGHGKPAGPQILDEMKGVVQGAIDTVQAGIDSGMGREAAVEQLTFIDRQPVPELFQSWAPDLQRLFVGRVYDQIQTRR